MSYCESLSFTKGLGAGICQNGEGKIAKAVQDMGILWTGNKIERGYWCLFTRSFIICENLQEKFSKSLDTPFFIFPIDFQINIDFLVRFFIILNISLLSNAPDDLRPCETSAKPETKQQPKPRLLCLQKHGNFVLKVCKNTSKGNSSIVASHQNPSLTKFRKRSVCLFILLADA